MKRLGQVIGMMLAGMLAVLSLQALAEAPLAGRDFNHDATGFPLTGVHTLTACETCHVSGVFKGTPRNCDACHALGKRIVATPKSTGHIVTDAPCETCHFNASTFLGARFNHGTAVPGQCRTCHNGRQSLGKPASHSAGNKVTDSCDSCHRSYTWFNTSWNHAGVVMGSGQCLNSGCHGPNSGNTTAATATSPINHNSYTDTRTKACDVCHISFASWNSTTHEPPTGTCAGCHNGTTAETHVTSSHPSTTGTTDCNQCHTSMVTWLGALGGKPSNHVPYTPTTTQCNLCHVGSTVVTATALHVPYFAGLACTTCHLSGAAYYWPNHAPSQKSSSHLGGKSDCTGCHTLQYNQWSGA